MSQITPPYIPRFGNGAPAGAAPNGTIYYDKAANYAAYIFNGGQWNKTAPVILGAGVPAAIAAPGTLYSRTDAAGVYSSTPALVTDTIVQHANKNGHSIPSMVTFAAPVTAGNLLLCYLGGGVPFDGGIDAANWTVLDTINQSGGVSALVAYRYAKAGDGATPPSVCSSINSFWGMTCAEISGVTGNIAVDVVHHLIEGGGATFNTTTPQNTTAAHELALLTMFAWDGTANFATPAGYASVDTWNDGAANYGSMSLCDQTPGSGTNVGNATVTRPAGSSGNNFASTIILAAGLAAGWTLIGP